MTTVVPHVQRCTVQRLFGVGQHRKWWQCLLTDPHPAGPEQPHDFGRDAEVFGRDLDAAPVHWLAATLRARAAREAHLQDRITGLSAIAAQLAQLAADGTPVSLKVGEWVRVNVPAAAVALDGTGRRWHSHVGTR